MVFNHRDVAGIFSMIRRLGGLIGCQEKAEALCERLAAGLEQVRESASTFAVRPSVYFEEWDDPLFAGSRWVSELVEIAGGRDCFRRVRPAFARQGPHHCGPARSGAPRAAHHSRVVVRQEIPAGERSRQGQAGARIPAVRDGQLHEVKSPIILQPGPAALTDGVARIHDICRAGRQHSTARTRLTCRQGRFVYSRA